MPSTLYAHYPLNDLVTFSEENRNMTMPKLEVFLIGIMHPKRYTLFNIHKA